MRIVVSILVVFLAVPALAQQPTAPPAPQTPPRLEPVVVEGVRVPSDRRRTDQEASEELSRVPGGTAVVDQPMIEQTRAANLKDVLDFVPGVMIRPRFGAADESQLSIRGSGLRNNFHLRGVNILIDGFVYGQADGFSDFESLGAHAELCAGQRAHRIRSQAHQAGRILRGAQHRQPELRLVRRRGQRQRAILRAR